MKSILSTLFLCIFVLQVNAQNIVPNPAFAVYDTCPSMYNQIRYCTNWRSPNTGTPEYFNACATSAVSIPLNLAGYQASVSNAYTGAYSFVQGGGQPEYITTTIPALQVGKTYTVTVNVSLADSSTHGCDGLGVFFYINAKPDSTTPALIPKTPQINYTSYGAITDKINWVRLTKTFVADSAYTHIVVGNFKAESALTKVVDPTVVTMMTPFAYYYYDSVIVATTAPSAVTNLDKTIGVTVSPSPFTENCTFQIDNATGKPCELSIFNLQGAVVRKVDGIIANEVRISRDNLPQGVYVYQLRSSENDIVVHGKILIQ